MPALPPNLARPSAAMRRALALAARGAGGTSPNPMVGAVLADPSAGLAVPSLGEGWHHRAGDPHAEVLALRAAGGRARGATLYVTLEPCAHHGRTPPCVDAIVAAGVSRVVAAMRDPDPRVAGRGFASLRAAGIAVDVGDGGPEAARLNRWYVTSRTLHRPRVLYKWAATCDGAVDLSPRPTAVDGGAPLPISGPLARREVHRLRAQLDAVVVGVGTVIADDPRLTVRGVRGRDPLRVVADRAARTPPTARVLPAMVCVAESAPAGRVAALRAAGADVRRAATPADILQVLHELGCLGVLLEGGPRLAAAFLAAGLIDEVACAWAPALLGPAGLRPFAGPDPAGPVPLPLSDVRVRRLGPDLWVTGTVAAPSPSAEGSRP